MWTSYNFINRSYEARSSVAMYFRCRKFETFRTKKPMVSSTRRGDDTLQTALQLTSKSICQDCGGASMRFIMRRAEIDIENTLNPMHIILRLNVDPKVIGLSSMV